MWNLYIEKFSHIDSSYVSLVPRHSPFLFSGLYLMLFYFYECKPKNFFPLNWEGLGTRLQLCYSLFLFLLLRLEFMVLHHLEVVGCSVVVGLEGESMPQRPLSVFHSAHLEQQCAWMYKTVTFSLTLQSISAMAAICTTHTTYLPSIPWNKF